VVDLEADQDDLVEMSHSPSIAIIDDDAAIASAASCDRTSVSCDESNIQGEEHVEMPASPSCSTFPDTVLDGDSHTEHDIASASNNEPPGTPSPHFHGPYWRDPPLGDTDLDGIWNAWEHVASTTSDSFDSQDTACEDPMGGVPIEQIEPEHWSVVPKFWTGVGDLLVLCEDAYFLAGMIPRLDARPLEFESCFEHACGFIDSIIGASSFFKIGMTGHPNQRWTRGDCGYQHDIDHNFTRMRIVYVAPYSRKSIADSAGAMDASCKLWVDSSVYTPWVDLEHGVHNPPHIEKPQNHSIVNSHQAWSWS
jgi:hypothetical protein